MSRIDVVIRGAGVVVVAGVLAAGGSYVVGGGGGDPISANLFAVASGGTASCVRSSTLITYDQAVAAGGGAICGSGNGNAGYSTQAFDNACWAATAGDIVAVRDGTYGSNGNGAIMDSGKDCSDGSGADYDPNWQEKGDAEGSLTNWVTFIPGQSPQNIKFTQWRKYFMGGNYHTIFKGIDWNVAIFTNYGGESSTSQRAQNLHFVGNSRTDRALVYGIQLIGSRNIMFKNINNGPSIQCAKDEALVPANFRCDPAGPWFESQYANIGTASAGCTPDATGPACGGFFTDGWSEAYIHDISAGVPYLNIRLENFINHDQQGKQFGAGVHPGCLMSFDPGNSSSTASHNLVLDGYVCERATGATLQMGDSGVTIQNSVFTCLVSFVSQTAPTGKWDQCAVSTGSPGGLACKATGGACTQTNVLVRYNIWKGESGQSPFVSPDQANEGGTYGSHSNIRVIGNLFYGSPMCGRTGITFDSNAFTNGSTPCGTNATVLSAGDPVVQSAITTPGNSWVEESVLDMHKDGSPALPTINPSVLGADYQLGWDADRDARSTTATRVGVDE
jgi:hypothetical protein